MRHTALEQLHNNNLVPRNLRTRRWCRHQDLLSQSDGAPLHATEKEPRTQRDHR